MLDDSVTGTQTNGLQQKYSIAILNVNAMYIHDFTFYLCRQL